MNENQNGQGRGEGGGGEQRRKSHSFQPCNPRETQLPGMPEKQVLPLSHKLINFNLILSIYPNLFITI